jgi:hypothetical protein
MIQAVVAREITAVVLSIKGKGLDDVSFNECALICLTYAVVWNIPSLTR